MNDIDLKRRKKRIIHRDKHNYQAIQIFKFIYIFNISYIRKISTDRMIGIRIINDNFFISISFN